MTIGFDGSRAFIEGKTGTENYSYQLIKNLSHIDTENNYLIYIRESQKSKVKTTHPSFGGQKWPENFKFVTINLPRLWTQIGLSFATFTDNLDVLFIPAHTLPLIRKPGLKTVITVHDLGAEFLPSSHQLKQILYLKLMTHYQLKTATKIIAVSEATKKDIIKRVGVEAEKIKVIYEGVDIKVFSPQSSAVSKAKTDNILRRYDLERNRYFIFVGTIQPRKNLGRLITAFSKFLSGMGTVSEQVLSIKYQVSTEKKHNTKYIIPNTSFKLVLVGQKGWGSDQIYSLPRKLGIEDRVEFLGRVSDSDLVGLYNGATALTYPSLFEGFGLPIIEAFACGCPVITSNTSSMPEVAGNAGILVDPLSEKEITAAMLNIYQNDSLRDKLIQKGLDRATHFNWTEVAKQTLEVLKKI